MNRYACLVLALGLVLPMNSSQVAQYEADSPKTILELQQFRRTTSQVIAGPRGQRGTATLIELNPNINSWYLLRLEWEDPDDTRIYHLENPDPQGTTVSLEEGDRRGLRISFQAGVVSCFLWQDRVASPLEEARRLGLPYVPLCAGRLYLRNPVAGTYTHLEEVTNFLRDHVWGGDRIVNFVKERFFQDHFAEKGTRASVSEDSTNAGSAVSPGPVAAQLDNAVVELAIVPEHLGLDVGDDAKPLRLGAWYLVNNAPGIYVSVIQPSAVVATNLQGSLRHITPLDSIEANATDYLVAFDLADFDLGFTLGTDHPRVDWSGRELPGMHDAHLAGPDGIGTSAPLARNGMVSPALTARTAATFTGGFKREHGAFRYGDLARQNHGTHYGFIEQGVIFSKLQPGLATIYVLDDGYVGMKTWTKLDDLLLPRLRYARQNGVPVIERSGVDDGGIPGALVSQWGAGNWSGSADEKFRTLRAGLCLQVSGARRFLIYGYFSTATPAAMARVFEGYRCQYAMHLDMNALEHTYLALYTRQGGQLLVQHLIEGMSEVDRKGGGDLAPRFLSFPDDRDFFYLVRRRPAANVRM